MASAPPPGGLSDEALLAGLTFGDPEAGRTFVHRFERRVFGLALAILRDPVLAEDVAQEAFLRAWRHGQSYDPRRGTVAAWLLRITRNMAIDTLRLRRAEVMDPDVLAAVAPPSDISVEDAALTSEAAEAVRRAMRQLPEELAEAADALLLAAPVAVPPAGFEDRVLERIETPGAARTAARTGVGSRARTRLRLLAAAAAAAVLLGVGGVAGAHLGRSSGDN